jgi:hypothetical protein
VAGNPLGFVDPSGHVMDSGGASGEEREEGIVDVLPVLEIVVTNLDNLGKALRDKPANIMLDIDLPVVIPPGYGIDGDVINYSTKVPIFTKQTSKVIGHGIGDLSNPALFFIGWGMATVGNAYQNIKTNQSLYKFIGDLVVDTGVYCFGEGLGDGAAVASAIVLPEFSPWLPLAAKFTTDMAIAAVSEPILERNNTRQQTYGLMTDIGTAITNTITSLEEYDSGIDYSNVDCYITDPGFGPFGVP